MRARSVLTSALLVAAFTVLWPVVAAASFFYDPRAVPSTHTGYKAARAGLKTPITPNGSWITYHHDNGHTGSDPTPNSVSSVKAGWTSPVLDEQVYASPLVYGGLVYVATMKNTVYALNQTDGSIQWMHHLRAPETGGWLCGNVSPQGIHGTPAIDLGTGRIYVVTFGSDDLYRVEGLRLSDGLEQITTTIPTTIGSGFDWTIQGERGALAIANGYVYVPFGGRAGDCGNYSGWVVGVPVSGSTSLNVFQTPDTGNGIWAAGGIVVNNATGDVFATTGNGVNNGSGDGCSADISGNPVFQNDAVVQLSPTLVEQSFFMPQDWQNNWCSNDEDLGGATSVLISPTLMFQAGKWGMGFLLNPNNLGGVDGQLFPTPAPGPYTEAPVCLGNVNDANFGSYAYAAPYVYLECNGHGIVALKIDTVTPSFTPCPGPCSSPDWEAAAGHTLGPPIVAAGAVWAIDTNGNGLYAFRASTGAQIFHSAAFGTNHFVTPAEAGGQVFAPAGNVIKQFVMHFGVSQSTAGTPPGRGTPVVPTPVSAPPSRQPAAQSSPTPPPSR